MIKNYKILLELKTQLNKTDLKVFFATLFRESSGLRFIDTRNFEIKDIEIKDKVVQK